MSTLVQLTGPAGSGKTFSIKSLTLSDRYKDATFLINVDGKTPSWAGWNTSFNKEKKNYVKVSDTDTIKTYLTAISEKMPHIKVAIVDTISTLMADKEMGDRKKVGHDKWYDYAADIYDLFSMAHKLRDDLIVVFCAHPEEYVVDGTTFFRTKTGGQKLTRLNLNSKLSYNLYTLIEREGTAPSYYFITQNLGNTEARSTEGVLELKMPNSLCEVADRIRKYDMGIEETLQEKETQNVK